MFSKKYLHSKFEPLLKGYLSEIVSYRITSEQSKQILKILDFIYGFFVMKEKNEMLGADSNTEFDIDTLREYIDELNKSGTLEALHNNHEYIERRDLVFSNKTPKMFNIPVNVNVKDDEFDKQVDLSITLKNSTKVSKDMMLTNYSEKEILDKIITEGRYIIAKYLYDDVVECLRPMEKRIEDLCMLVPESKELKDLNTYCKDMIKWLNGVK